MTVEMSIGGVVQVMEISDEERTETEVWTRVMGYYRPVDHWNVGKRAEFEERKWFKYPGGL